MPLDAIRLCAYMLDYLLIVQHDGGAQYRCFWAVHRSLFLSVVGDASIFEDTLSARQNRFTAEIQ